MMLNLNDQNYFDNKKKTKNNNNDDDEHENEYLINQYDKNDNNSVLSIVKQQSKQKTYNNLLNQPQHYNKKKHIGNENNFDDLNNEFIEIMTSNVSSKTPLTSINVKNDNIEINSINDDKNDNDNYDNISLLNNTSNNRSKTKLLYFIDTLLSAIVFAPLSAVYWYGSWSFLDQYFITNNILLSSLLCYLLGLIILLPGYLLQNKLQSVYDNCNKITKFFIKLIYIYIISLAVVLEWRGCWTLCDSYIQLDWKGQLSLSIIAIAYMLIARSFRLVTSSPFLLLYDDNEYYFTTRSRYLIQTNTYIQYAFDFLVIELIESFAAIIAWRGFSLMLDLFLYPDSKNLSIIISIIVGHLLYFIIVLFQYKIYKRFIIKLSLIPRLIVEDILNLIMFTSVVILWRVYWMIIDIYLFDQNYRLLIYLLYHFISFILSIITNASVVVTGSGYDFKDGEINDDHTLFHITYLATIFQDSFDTMAIASEETRAKNRRYTFLS